MKHIFECIKCGRRHYVNRQKYIYFLGSSCEECGGPLIEKQGEGNASQQR